MEVLHRRCAGLDVHKKTVVACARLMEGDTIHYEVRTFGTTTSALLALGDWLRAHGCTHAVLESTGVYWQPVWHVLAEELELVLAHAAALEASFRALEEEIATALAPFRRAVAHALTVPGVNTTAAPVILAEIGTDMSRFPTAGHLRSWARLSPRLDESAGRHRSRRIQRGGRWLKATLIQCAWGAIQVRDSYPRALYPRLVRRHGKKPAIVAVAAALLTAIYHMLRTDQDYRDLGPAHFTDADRQRAANRLARRLRALGYEVSLRPAA